MISLYTCFHSATFLKPTPGCELNDSVFQIKSLRILKPRLERDQILRVIEGLKSIPELQKLTITNPAAFNGLPHHTALRELKLTGLPQYSPDWRWLTLYEDLDVIDLSFKTNATSEVSLPDVETEEHIYVSGETARVEGMTADGTMVIMENLPHAVRIKVNPLFQK